MNREPVGAQASFVLQRVKTGSGVRHFIGHRELISAGVKRPGREINHCSSEVKSACCSAFTSPYAVMVCCYNT